MLQSPAPVAGAVTNAGESGETLAEAPPKQVALAMDRLAHAARLIADIRLAADRLLEALFVAAELPHQSEKPLHLLVKEESLMRQHLQDLRTVGKQLEASGVLTGSMQSRGNSWGLHMPLICPDGAVVAYAWKRQLAGQAGASAVDRTRLALKAFTDQKKRFFPHLEDDATGRIGDVAVAKKRFGAQPSTLAQREGTIAERTLSDVLIQIEKKNPEVKIFTYQRLDWLARASSLSATANVKFVDPSKEQGFHSSSKPKTGSVGAVTANQTAVIELFIPSIFRAIVSLHPAGSITPDAVAFFSPDEGGSYIHARGVSVYHVFKQIAVITLAPYLHSRFSSFSNSLTVIYVVSISHEQQEHADNALQYFLSAKSDASLDFLLHWICCYQRLFTKSCSKCGRLLTMDKCSALLFPPVHRPFRQLTLPTRDQSSEVIPAYHIGCSSEG